jgi:hypothetical protein
VVEEFEEEEGVEIAGLIGIVVRGVGLSGGD